MLFRSGHNLEAGAIEFIESNDSITLFSAYLKLEALKRINTRNNIKQIIVRWEIQDLCLGASDLNLYNYCKENNIVLFRNTRIHLKVIWNNQKSVFLGSANVTGRGLGEQNQFNYELNANAENISFNDICYLNKIKNTSELIDDNLFKRINDLVNQVSLPTITYPVFDTKKEQKDFFLTSQLPMSFEINQLYQLYKNPVNLIEKEQLCLSHDLILYEIPIDLNEKDFFKLLKTNFNKHPFIDLLKKHIQEQQSLNYGGVVRFIQEKTTTVPTPRSWELKKKQIVNILYEWICYFNINYTWDRPTYSQVIYFNDK